MNRTVRGFGLLEALVALVLLSAVGMSLFGWINTNLDAATRLQAREQAQQAERLASAWVQTLNPRQQGRGETEPAPGWRLRWDSRALTPLTGGTPLPGGTSTPFKLALYEVSVELQNLDRPAAPPYRWTLRRLGHERLALASLPSPNPGTP